MAFLPGKSELEGYPSGFSDLATYFTADAKYYLVLIVVFTALAFMSRGLEGLKWTRNMKISALTSYGMLQFNIFVGFIFFAGLYLVQDIYASMRLPQVPEAFWDPVPAPLLWLFLLMVYDFSVYWTHRILHGKWLWPMHAVHHSDEDMHFLSWSRGHALEQSIFGIAAFLCSAWIGVAIEDFAILATLRAMHQYYVHANIDWDHGPFKLLLVSPQFHRWHHANVEEAFDKNFASIFPFYDKMFGTYYYPHSAVDVPTGFDGSPKNNLLWLIIYPFTEWYEMAKRRIRKAARVKSDGMKSDRVS